MAFSKVLVIRNVVAVRFLRDFCRNPFRYINANSIWKCLTLIGVTASSRESFILLPLRRIMQKSCERLLKCKQLGSNRSDMTWQYIFAWELEARNKRLCSFALAQKSCSAWGGLIEVVLVGHTENNSAAATSHRQQQQQRQQHTSNLKLAQQQQQHKWQH